jgi:hypothetical protein
LQPRIREADIVEAGVQALYYEIRVAGMLPPEALVDYEQLTIAEPVETVVHGQLADQAALYGLLARLETLGVHVLEVRQLRPQRPSAAGPR